MKHQEQEKAFTYLDPVSGDVVPAETAPWRAPSGAPFMPTLVAGADPFDIDKDNRSIWRYRNVLPIGSDAPISLGEGCTPLVASDAMGPSCQFKLEWFSPTGSFKDRGASVMMTFIRDQDVKQVHEDSSGNGGAAVAAYGAAAGIQVRVLVPESTQPAKIAQIRAYGADIQMVPGPREATEAAAMELVGSSYYASHNWHPMFLQGTKTLGYEIWEDLGHRAPQNIVVPAGAGSNVLGCYLAFKELKAAGAIDQLPRLFATQPANCAPLHATFQAGADQQVDAEYTATIAEGTAIKQPIRLKQLLTALRETGGGTVAVEEEEILRASLQLARSGIYVEPTSAHAAAGFAQLVAANQIAASDDTVVVLTGSGLKATYFYTDQFE